MSKKKTEKSPAKAAKKTNTRDPRSTDPLLKKFGDSYKTLDELAEMQDSRGVLDTGCFLLNAAMNGYLDPVYGNGGIPELTISEFSGPDNSGKTILLLTTIKETLERDPNAIAVVYFAEEPDSKHLRAHNLPNDRFIMLVDDPKKMEPKQRLATRRLSQLVEASKDPRVAIIAIDSIPAMILPQVFEDETKGQVSDIEDVSIASWAKLLQVFISQYLGVRHRASLIMINHAASKVKITNAQKVMGEAVKLMTVGGKFARHISKIRIEVNSIPIRDKVKNEDGKYAQIGVEITFRVFKNKTGVKDADRIVIADFSFEECRFLNEYAVINYALALEHPKFLRRGNWYFYGGEIKERVDDEGRREKYMEGGVSANGKDAVAFELYKDQKMLNELKKELYKSSDGYFTKRSKEVVTLGEILAEEDLRSEQAAVSKIGTAGTQGIRVE